MRTNKACKHKTEGSTKSTTAPKCCGYENMSRYLRKHCRIPALDSRAAFNNLLNLSAFDMQFFTFSMLL